MSLEILDQLEEKIRQAVENHFNYFNLKYEELKEQKKSISTSGRSVAT